MTTEEITKYIFIEDEPSQGDVALVFGTWHAWESSVEKAVELYHKKLVPKIIVSGGLNQETGLVEGNLMAAKLLSLGVPREDILIENKATNTLENVLFSKKLLDEVLGLDTIKVIVAVVKNYHARRALMALKKQMPPHITFKVASYFSPVFNFTKDSWHQSKFGRKKITGELAKIKKYLADGSLEDLT